MWLDPSWPSRPGNDPKRGGEVGWRGQKLGVGTDAVTARGKHPMPPYYLIYRVAQWCQNDENENTWKVKRCFFPGEEVRQKGRENGYTGPELLNLVLITQMQWLKSAARDHTPVESLKRVLRVFLQQYPPCTRCTLYPVFGKLITL